MSVCTILKCDVFPQHPSEIHQFVRDLGRRNKNAVISRASRMSAVRLSQVLDKRGIPCVTVTKDEFISAMASTGARPSLKRKLDSRPHRLPKEFSTLLKSGAPLWPSPTPTTMRNAYSAFTWAMHYYHTFADDPTVSLHNGVLSCLLLNFTMIRRLSDDAYFLSLQRASFVTLAIRLEPIGDTSFYKVVGNITELHALKVEGEFNAMSWAPRPPSYLLIHHRDLAAHQAMLVQRVGAETGLVKYMLATSICCADSDLQFIASEYVLEYFLLRSFVRQICQNIRAPYGPQLGLAWASFWPT